MNLITKNLHCIGAVGRDRATLCRLNKQDVLSRVCLLVEGQGSRVTSRGSRVNGGGSRVNGRGSRITSRESKNSSQLFLSVVKSKFHIGPCLLEFPVPVFLSDESVNKPARLLPFVD